MRDPVVSSFAFSRASKKDGCKNINSDKFFSSASKKSVLKNPTFARNDKTQSNVSFAKTTEWKKLSFRARSSIPVEE